MDERISPRDKALLSADVLGRVPLFANLTSEELAEIASSLRIRRYQKGEYVLLKGGTGDALLILLSGCLQALDYTENGNEIGVNFFMPGSFLGELALIDGLPRSASVIALEASTVAFLPRAKALALIYGKPAVTDAMLKHLVGTIRRMTVWREILAMPSAPQRLYALLFQLKRPLQDGREGIFKLPTQRQLAIMLNTSRETVSRVLASLQRRGIVEKWQSHVLIIHRAQELRKLAEGGAAQDRPAQ